MSSIDPDRKCRRVFTNMSDLSLCESCLRKIAINLRDGIYKSCHENPFSVMPSKFVNDIMSASLDLQRADELRAGDLEQLLTSGKLRELKMHEIDVHQELLQVLNSLISGCQELEVFHLKGLISFEIEHSERLRSEVSEALGNLLRNAPNLKDLHSCFPFDLKALRNCKKLRSVRLHFLPQQPLYNFLANENGLFQPHEYLEFFSVCRLPRLRPVPNGDIAVILLYCPELTYLGHIDTSGALLQLHRMGMLLSELKLRHFYWQDTDNGNVDVFNPGIYTKDIKVANQVRDAVLHYPLFEELDIITSSIQSISCLRNLRNLVFLNITLPCDDNRSAVFRNVLQEIGPQLKHLSFTTGIPMDISVLLQNCPNLESLRISGNESTDFAHPAISLPNLQRLTLFNLLSPNCHSAKQIFSLLSDCNQLTEMFLLHTPYCDDQTMHRFLSRNSLSNLKIAYLSVRGLTEHGFREFLLNAPQLEVVEINIHDLSENHFERVVCETNHKAICNKDLLSDSDEFFEKRRAFNNCN